MVSDFKILVHRNSDNLHLKLFGNFDVFAAHDVVNAIKTYETGAYSIFIHTSNLERIDPWGPDSFRTALYSLNKHCFGNLVFTGNNAVAIAPKGCQIL